MSILYYSLASLAGVTGILAWLFPEILSWFISFLPVNPGLPAGISTSLTTLFNMAFSFNTWFPVDTLFMLFKWALYLEVAGWIFRNVVGFFKGKSS